MPAQAAVPARRPARRTQAERTETTTRHLLGTARELFATQGFAETSIEDLVRRAGVTRGALYHHFANKSEVFRAVLEAETLRIHERLIAAASRKRDPWKRLEAACLAFFDECTDPEVQQLMLLDAPAVLGWEAMREIEGSSMIASLEAAIEAAMAEGTLRRRDPAALGHAIFGAMCELSMMAARAADRPAALKAARRELQALLRALAAG